MAGPLNGISGQQVFPASNTFQQTQNNNVSQNQDAQPQEGTIQPQGTAAAESQSVETQNQDSEAGIGFQAEAQSGHSQERGSLVDITV